MTQKVEQSTKPPAKKAGQSDKPAPQKTDQSAKPGAPPAGLAFDPRDLLPSMARTQVDGPKVYEQVLSWDAPVTTDPLSHKAWQPMDIAVIGSRRLVDGLRTLAQPLQLRRDNWRDILHIVRPAFVIVDPFFISADGTWSLDDLRDADPDDENSVFAILEGFDAAGIPTVFWNTFDIVYRQHLQKLAGACSLRAYSDTKHKSKAYHMHLPPACTPSVQSALAPTGGFAKNESALWMASEHQSSALFDGWADILRFRDGLSFLDRLANDGLTVVESRYRLWANQRDALGVLSDNLLGCVTRPSLWSLLRNTQVRIASDHTLVPPHERAWSMIETASCGAVTFMDGARPQGVSGDVCQAFSNGDKLVGAVEALQADPVAALVSGQKAWRAVTAGETMAHRLDAICAALDIESDFAHKPLVTVLCATFRTEYIGHILRHFDAQTYPNKELVMAVNTSHLTEKDIRKEIGSRKDVRIVVVPAERVEAGSLNHGIAIAQGEYIVKMDDDDIYGPHYVSDMMAHALSHGLELFGKTNRFFYFTEHDATFERKSKKANAMVGPAEILNAHIGGATLSGEAAFFRENPYRDGNFSATDTHYYSNLEGHLEARVAVLDDTGFLYRRRNAAEHSWTMDNDQMLSRMSRLGDGIDTRVLE